MKRNVLDEVKRRQEEPREIQVVKSRHSHRDVSTYDYIIHALNLRDTKRSLTNVSSIPALLNQILLAMGNGRKTMNKLDH